jgi:hypothetical protein
MRLHIEIKTKSGLLEGDLVLALRWHVKGVLLRWVSAPALEVVADSGGGGLLKSVNQQQAEQSAATIWMASKRLCTYAREEEWGVDITVIDSQGDVDTTVKQDIQGLILSKYATLAHVNDRIVNCDKSSPSSEAPDIQETERVDVVLTHVSGLGNPWPEWWHIAAQTLALAVSEVAGRDEVSLTEVIAAELEEAVEGRQMSRSVHTK